MALPYQCLAACSRATNGDEEWAIFGATGPRLVVQSSGGATCTWAVEQTQARELEPEDGERPGKRVKLTPPTEQKPNFSILKISSDKTHLVAVTAEDKCIRVFHIGPDWSLQQLSERCMPRRPSSIALTANDTILCADKFGDVYALPLIPNPEEEAKEILEREKREQAKFIPSASVLTVHSGRNRRILEEQLKQAESGQVHTRETPKFKHDLLLGHVSMLTDIVCATLDGRSFIITADRDEHIRVSRGLPQAHIIEGFCQGHEEFVSRLCVVRPSLLVSGGGDADLHVWNWMSGRLVQKLPIRNAVDDFFRDQGLSPSLPRGSDATTKVAVSGIWRVPYEGSQAAEILVACEGVPALFSFKPEESSSALALALQGNALDVAFIERDRNTRVAAVSIDNVHQCGSTTAIRDTATQDAPRVQYYARTHGGQWAVDGSLPGILQWMNGETIGSASDMAASDEKALRDLLYGVENLRKRPGAED